MAKHPDLRDVEAQRLAQLFSVDADADEVWDDRDVGAIFRHLLVTPFFDDLVTLDNQLATKLAVWKSGASGSIETFADLLQHPIPPLELLELVKEFAKRSGTRSVGKLPSDVAAALYLLVITAALVRCNQGITSLDNESLKSRIQWASSLPWMDGELIELLELAASRLG